MRKGFSFVEVLVSIVILAFLGTALIKFNSFNKRAMERAITMQENTLLSSSILFQETIDDGKEIELFDLTDFNNLDDDYIKFLKSIRLKATLEIEDKIFIGNDGEENQFMEYGDIIVQRGDFKQNYLWIQREE